MAVNIKYISMNIEPNGNTPAAGMTKLGSAYHGASGIGRGILLTRQGGSYLPLQCLPKMVPATDNGMATNNQMAIILKITDTGMTLIVPYPMATQLSTNDITTIKVGNKRIVQIIVFGQWELFSARVV